MGTKRVIRNATIGTLISDAFGEYQLKNKVRNLPPSTLRGNQECFERSILRSSARAKKAQKKAQEVRNVHGQDDQRRFRLSLLSQ